MNSLDSIAAQLEGYDPDALRTDAALAFLRALVKPVQASQELPLKQALGQVLAHDVVSPINVPAHDNSAMDGYAFQGAQLDAGAALSLHVVGTALAGKAWTKPVGRGQCLRIMTGAIMPGDLDTVVPQEFVTLSGSTIRFPPDRVKAGDNRRCKGEDIALGSVALSRGTLLQPAALGLLASLGIATVRVHRRLRVAFFSTGDEVLSLGEPQREGAVYDSNRYTLFGLLSRMGVELIDMGVIADDPIALEQAFTAAAAQADAVISSGGVSVGEADHTKAILRKLAAQDGGVVFWKIAMRPGRPMAVGRLKQAVLFGLPGNPVAVMVTFLAFVRPALLQMMGCHPAQVPAQPMLRARSTQTIRKKPGRTEYQRAIVRSAADGGLEVRITGQQGSGVLSSMVQANGLLVLGHEQGDVAVGQEVDVMMFDGVI